MGYKAWVFSGEVYRKHCKGCKDLLNQIFHGHKKTDRVTVYCMAADCEIPRKEGYFKPVYEKEDQFSTPADAPSKTSNLSETENRRNGRKEAV